MGQRPETRTCAWRPGDQRHYVSDTSRFRHATGWSPKVSVHEGAMKLMEWLREAHTERKLRARQRLATLTRDNEFAVAAAATISTVKERT